MSEAQVREAVLFHSLLEKSAGFLEWGRPKDKTLCRVCDLIFCQMPI